MTEQLYQVWDWKKNDVQGYYHDKHVAEQEAARLNYVHANDWNGLSRYQAMEAND